MTEVKPPVVRLQFTKPDYDYDDNLTVFVNGQAIISESYGGEPEDNCRCRDYKWVELALESLAIALGATVEILETTETGL